MRVSANQMIHFQMALPPPKQRLNPPAERINKGDFFGRQVLSICSDPVDFASNAQADEIDRVTHSVVFISHPDLPEEKDAVALYEGIESTPTGYSSSAEQRNVYQNQSIHRIVDDPDIHGQQHQFARWRGIR